MASCYVLSARKALCKYFSAAFCIIPTGLVYEEVAVNFSITTRLPYILVRHENGGKSVWYRVKPNGIEEFLAERTSFFSSINYDTEHMVFSDDYLGGTLTILGDDTTTIKENALFEGITEIALATHPLPLRIKHSWGGDGIYDINGKLVAKIDQIPGNLELRSHNHLTVVRGGQVWIKTRTPTSWLFFDGSRVYSLKSATVINVATSVAQYVPVCSYPGGVVTILSHRSSFIASAGGEWNNGYGTGGFVDGDICFVTYNIDRRRPLYVSLIYKTDRPLPLWVFTTENRIDNAFFENDTLYFVTEEHAWEEQETVSAWDVNRGYLWSATLTDCGITRTRNEKLAKMSELCHLCREFESSSAHLHIPTDSESEEWLAFMVSEELLRVAARAGDIIPARMETVIPESVRWQWTRGN